MLKTIAELRVPYVMMHMRGTPQNMQEKTQYDDLIKDIIFYFSERIAAARQVGIIDFIIDRNSYKRVQIESGKYFFRKF